MFHVSKGESGAIPELYRSHCAKKTSVYHCHCPPADGKATELRPENLPQF